MKAPTGLSFEFREAYPSVMEQFPAFSRIFPAGQFPYIREPSAQMRQFAIANAEVQAYRDPKFPPGLATFTGLTQLSQ